MKRKITSICLLICLLINVMSFSVSASGINTADLSPGISDNRRIDLVKSRRYQSHTSSSSSSSVNSPFAWGIAILVIAAIGIVKYLQYKLEYPKDDDTAAERKLQKKINRQETVSAYGEPKNFTEQITGQIRKRDGSFSADKFIWLVENYFIAYMNAYSERDLELLEKLTTDDIFFDDKAKIEEQLQNGTAHKRKKISFQTDYIYKYEYNNRFEYVTTYIKSKMIDYMENVKTGESYHGSKNTDQFAFYTITLRRRLDEKTMIFERVRTVACPNCGASMDAVVAGKCPYCGKSSKTTEEAWKISAIRQTNLGADLGQAGIFRIT